VELASIAVAVAALGFVSYWAGRLAARFVNSTKPSKRAFSVIGFVAKISLLAFVLASEGLVIGLLTGMQQLSGLSPEQRFLVHAAALACGGTAMYFGTSSVKAGFWRLG
jgi:hypothetical protein